ncbi:MAG TPA: DUF3175 domain-containing protein [Alphaproteobacteria bacterium]|nr:DUF3175 domain-containing protein [Alphaproteobacteria bacterium]
MAAKRTRTTASARRKPSRRRWSARVTQRSDALDLDNKVFVQRDPKLIARSLKRSAERSKRRKGSPLQSAMSMLNFYINRAGRNLPAAQKKKLAAAKDELRRLFGRA